MARKTAKQEVKETLDDVALKCPRCLSTDHEPISWVKRIAILIECKKCGKFFAPIDAK